MVLARRSLLWSLSWMPTQTKRVMAVTVGKMPLPTACDCQLPDLCLPMKAPFSRVSGCQSKH